MSSLLCNIKISLKNHSYCVHFLVRLINHRKKSILVEVDALDAFTSHLVNEKANKWENMKIKTKSFVPVSNLKINRVHQNIQRNVTIESLSGALQEGIEENNVESIMEILEECKRRKVISLNVSMNVLSYFAQIGHIEGIKLIQEMYVDVNPRVLSIYGDFQQYLAEATWIKGNIPKALLIFLEVYKNNRCLRQNIRIVLRYLYYNASQKNSEASMVAISKFSEQLANDFQDYTPLMNLWKICLLSEWYSDQVLAEELLERNEMLIKIVLSQTSQIVGLALKYHKIESVYKLLEMLLKYKCKTESSIVLISLFDYKLRQRDLFSCTQILKWATKYDILIPSLQQEKALQLLLNGNTTKKVKNCTLKF
nr:uncharacterized protein LOC111418877 [Onthophagus taurus]